MKRTMTFFACSAILYFAFGCNNPPAPAPTPETQADAGGHAHGSGPQLAQGTLGAGGFTLEDTHRVAGRHQLGRGRIIQGDGS